MKRYTVPKDSRGRFPARHTGGVDPGLVGLRAFGHPAVREYHRWLLGEWEPRSTTLLLTPCSNVKPYTLSPTSRKVRGLLRRLGLWDGDRPRGIDWVFLSDLLVLVPYHRAEEYPACCYELHPDELLASPRHYNTVVEILSRLIEGKLADRQVILYLPRKHLRIWEDARRRATRQPEEHRVRYSIFGVSGLREVISALVSSLSQS